MAAMAAAGVVKDIDPEAQKEIVKRTGELAMVAAETQAGVVKDVTGVALSEEGRAGLLRTVDEAGNVVLGTVGKVGETAEKGISKVTSTVFGRTTSSDSKKRMIGEAVDEYLSVYTKSEDEKAAKSAFAKKLNEVKGYDRYSGVTLTTDDYKKALQDAKEISGAYGGCDDCGGSKAGAYIGGILAAAVTESHSVSGGADPISVSACIDIAMMILAIIFIVALFYWIAVAKNSENCASTKNILSISGIMILVLGTLKML